MPGCYEDARAVLNGEFDRLETSERVSSTEGDDDCARAVYRVGDVVYKLDGEYPDNEVEFDILTDLARYEWAPPVSLFTIGKSKVLCMPYYRNYDWCPEIDYKVIESIGDIITARQRERRFGHRFGTADLHTGNYRVIAPGKVMIIDAAGDFGRN